MHERLAAIVAIPVRDEAERIPACLDALAAQRNGYGQPLRADTFGVVLMLNNCTDNTADIVRQMRDRLPFCVWVVERQLPAMMAHAGWARKLAMDAAADLLSAGETAQSRVIMTTDADARVGPRWISVNLATIAAGADLVAGFVRADRAEHARLPIAVIQRGQLESRYEWLLAELLARMDLEAHDPWPRHRIASGASLALTLAAYRRVGGLAPIATGEDRALANSINLIGGRTRHSLAAQVVVSCRLDGRAAGGMAATIRQRALMPNLACDPALEPAANLLRRARWRAALRRRHQQGVLRAGERWEALLQLSRSELSGAMAMSQFGTAWAAIEQASPVLAYHPLSPRELPGQIVLAEHLVMELRAGRPLPEPPQYVDPIEFGPILQHDPRERSRSGEEALRRLVAGQRVVGLTGPMHENHVAAEFDSAVGECGHALEVGDAPVVDHL